MSDEAREDGGMKDADISGALGVGLSMVERVRRRCVEEGIESALNRKKQLRSEDTGRRARSPVDSDGLRGTAGGSRQLDPEAVG